MLGASPIAERLMLTRKTVRNHVSNEFAELGVSDRSIAIGRARKPDSGAVRRPPRRTPMSPDATDSP